VDLLNCFILKSKELKLLVNFPDRYKIKYEKNKEEELYSLSIHIAHFKEREREREKKDFNEGRGNSLCTTIKLLFLVH